MKKYSLVILCAAVSSGPYLFSMESGNSHDTSSKEELTTLEEAVPEDLLQCLFKSIAKEIEGQNSMLPTIESKVVSMHVSTTGAVDALNDPMRARMKKYDAAKKYWASQLDEVVHDNTRQLHGEAAWSGAEQLVWEDYWKRLGSLLICPVILSYTIEPAIRHIKQELQKLAKRAGLDDFDAQKIVDSFFTCEEK